MIDLVSLLPYLNTGMILLNTDLVFRRLGVGLTLKNYMEHPILSLLGGLGLIAESSMFGLILASALSGYTPTAVFGILFFIYLLLVFGKRGKSGSTRHKR